MCSPRRPRRPWSDVRPGAVRRTPGSSAWPDPPPGSTVNARVCGSPRSGSTAVVDGATAWHPSSPPTADPPTDQHSGRRCQVAAAGRCSSPARRVLLVEKTSVAVPPLGWVRRLSGRPAPRTPAPRSTCGRRSYRNPDAECAESDGHHRRCRQNCCAPAIRALLMAARARYRRRR